MCIFLFWSANVIFSTLTKNILKKFNSKKVKNLKKFDCLVLFCPKIVYNFLSINDFFAQITFFMIIMKRSTSTRGFKN